MTRDQPTYDDMMNGLQGGKDSRHNNKKSQMGKSAPTRNNSASRLNLVEDCICRFKFKLLSSTSFVAPG